MLPLDTQKAAHRGGFLMEFSRRTAQISGILRFPLDIFGLWAILKQRALLSGNKLDGEQTAVPVRYVYTHLTGLIPIRMHPSAPMLPDSRQAETGWQTQEASRSVFAKWSSRHLESGRLRYGAHANSKNH